MARAQDLLIARMSVNYDDRNGWADDGELTMPAPSAPQFVAELLSLACQDFDWLAVAVMLVNLIVVHSLLIINYTTIVNFLYLPHQFNHYYYTCNHEMKDWE